MRTITIPIDLDTALELLAAEPVLIELKASGPGVNVFVEAMRVEQSTVADVDPPPTPAPTPKPVAKKAAPAKIDPLTTAITCGDCPGRTFASAQGLAVHRARAHKASPVAAVPPLPPTPIDTGRSSTTPPAAAPTRPSSMCDRGDHTMCATARARCNCTCHGRHGQQPPASAAS